VPTRAASVKGVLTPGRPISILRRLAPVAQLDRVPGYELGGRRFESFRARHIRAAASFGKPLPFPGSASCIDGRARAMARSSTPKPPIARTGVAAYHRSTVLPRIRGSARRLPRRGIAQPGRAPALGAGCREFESLYPDHRSRCESPTNVPPRTRRSVDGAGTHASPSHPSAADPAASLRAMGGVVRRRNAAARRRPSVARLRRPALTRGIGSSRSGCARPRWGLEYSGVVAAPVAQPDRAPAF
jgi:hypothetical protein